MIYTFYNTKQGSVTFNNSIMEYVAFGHGHTPLIILPGLGDGLKTVKGQAMLLAIYYRIFAKEFRVYMFSRKNDLEKGYTTKDMAKDQKAALEKLGIDEFCLMGVSQGGMVAQHIAIEYPAAVKKLVLGVSISKPNDTFTGIVCNWIQFAQNDDYKALMIDTFENLYSSQMLKKYRWMYPFIGKVGKPQDFSRFLIQAESCLTHNTYDKLEKIECPTLILGGSADKAVGAFASEEMSHKIRGSKLIVYDGYGHGVYEESKDFNRQVKSFLSS